MPTLFHITPASTTISLDSSRKGRATFTVTNASGLQMQARANVVALDPNTRGWFRLAEDPEHSFGAGDTTQYTVQIDVPARAPAGRVSFRLDVVGVENPDEDYTEGPPVQVVVPETPEESRPFPWWILAVAGGVLLIGIILAIVLWPRQATVPYVRGLPEAAAWATIQAARLEPVVDEVPNPAPIGQAIATTPEADTRLRRGSEVNLIVSAGQTATPAPTATPEPTPMPVTHSTGSLAIDQTWMADLDEGQVDVGAGMDIWFEAETATERYVTPTNGAMIAAVGTSSIGREGCAAAPLSNSRIPIQSLPAGAYVCVRTNQGRFSQFRVNAAVGPSPGVLQIEYTTWE